MLRRQAIVLLIGIAFAWGSSWLATRALLDYLPPLWVTSLRSSVATVALFSLAALAGRVVVPRRDDLPIILNISLLHMIGFSALVSIGLQFVPVGRSVVLAYTTPFWVTIGSKIILNERVPRASILGTVLGMAGLGFMFSPSAFSWSDTNAVFGNGLVLLAAFFWAASILLARRHKWTSTPFEMAPWQALLATAILIPLSAKFEQAPHVALDWKFVALLLYGGVVGIAFPYWATVTVTRSLPAVTTSLGLLGVPLVGVFGATVVFGESFELPLAVGFSLIVFGIILGLMPGNRGPAKLE